MFGFSVDPEYQMKLDWADSFVTEEVEPLVFVFKSALGPLGCCGHEGRSAVDGSGARRGAVGVPSAAELGGGGYGQVKLALLNEILGRTAWGPIVFGCQAPDSGNAEILAHFGTEQQKARFLQPLLDAEITSCFAMTEPHAGADPRLFKVRAERIGDGWRLSGDKWFASNARWANFLIVMAITDPDVPVIAGRRCFSCRRTLRAWSCCATSAFTARARTNGRTYLRFHDVELPADSLLGAEGGAFEVAQVRLAVAAFTMR